MSHGWHSNTPTVLPLLFQCLSPAPATASAVLQSAVYTHLTHTLRAVFSKMCTHARDNVTASAPVWQALMGGAGAAGAAAASQMDTEESESKSRGWVWDAVQRVTDSANAANGTCLLYLSFCSLSC